MEYVEHLFAVAVGRRLINTSRKTRDSLCRQYQTAAGAGWLCWVHSWSMSLLTASPTRSECSSRTSSSTSNAPRVKLVDSARWCLESHGDQVIIYCRLIMTIVNGIVFLQEAQLLLGIADSTQVSEGQQMIFTVWRITAKIIRTAIIVT